MDDLCLPSEKELCLQTKQSTIHGPLISVMEKWLIMSTQVISSFVFCVGIGPNTKEKGMRLVKENCFIFQKFDLGCFPFAVLLGSCFCLLNYFVLHVLVQVMINRKWLIWCMWFSYCIHFELMV